MSGRRVLRGCTVRGRDDRGSITVLSLGFFALALTLVLIVTEVSAGLLARRNLAAVCDAAALAAANSAGAAGVGEPVAGSALPLDPGAAAAAVASYRAGLVFDGDRDAADGALRLDLRVVGTTATVNCSRPLHLPGLGVLGVPGSALPVVRASASARTQIG